MNSMDNDDPTRPLASETQRLKWSGDRPDVLGEQEAVPGESSEAGATAYRRSDREPASPSLREVIRPTGISWVTVMLGALCLGLASLILTLQLNDLSVDWSIAAPAIVVAAGVLLVLIGIGSMVRGRSREDHPLA